MSEKDAGGEKEFFRNHCQFCGRRCEKLKHVLLLALDLWVCPACEKRIRDKIRHRYMIAGEQTEPAE